MSNEQNVQNLVHMMQYAIHDPGFRTWMIQPNNTQTQCTMRTSCFPEESSAYDFFNFLLTEFTMHKYFNIVRLVIIKYDNDE